MYRKLLLVYEGERLLGGVEFHQQGGGFVFGEEIKEIRISHFSPPSERCPPLAVLHTVNSAGKCFKLESTSKKLDSPLSLMHTTCLRDNKAAVATIGGGEFHLVAMHSRKSDGQNPVFWGFNVASSLYNSCLVMLNLRCLGIVFDLDETLIVANTMRSFEDRIDSLQRKINSESDPQRIASMLAEVKRYQDDKTILKQYAESDQVIDNGKVIRSESEVVLAVSDNQQTIVRPIIRLQDRNIILTRINPLIRDTSVLVRLRPAWEDLKSYLIAKGRKRFEVFVCTMAERDYALEMWRLLDPDSNLINPRELLDRIVCVKSGSRKSLFHVFQDGNCHPKLALVIDDRLKVWDEKDQQRVHVVPAFTPYFAPQAEANNTVPVLCVARNVACNVRGSFFKDFDEGLMQRISEVAYEDDTKDLPSAPDVGNYLVSEVDPSENGNKDSVGFDGMADAEVERRLKEATHATSTVHPPTIKGSATPFLNQQLPQLTQILKTALAGPGQVETPLRSSPAREEGEVPESELDPDTRRRLLILQHGQDMREHPLNDQVPAQAPGQVPVSGLNPRGWFPVEEEMRLRELNQVSPSMQFNAEPHLSNFLHQTSIPPGRVLESQRLPKEELPQQDLRLNEPFPAFHSISGGDSPMAQLSSPNKNLDLEAGQINPCSLTSVEALWDIAFKCGTKVDFKQTLVSSTELQFSVEVLFAGKKIGQGTGKTRREAQRHAADGSLFYLADKFLSQPKSDANSFGYQSSPKEEVTSSRSSSSPRILDPRMETSKRLMSPISALKELCIMEGLGVAFYPRPQFSANWGQKNEVCAEVEINGQVLGKGIGLTLDEAKSKAAEKALGAVKSMLGQYPYKRQASPRFMQDGPNKRLKAEASRVLYRMPSTRHPKNAP
ncbi:hypothetical protein ACS0TY_018118 [Phlomoides rotata]